MQKRTDILTSLIADLGLKLKQKELAFKMLSEIITQYNILEGNYQRWVKAKQKIKSDFVDYYDRVYTLLYILNITEQDIFSLNYKYTEWIKKNEADLSPTFTMSAAKELFYYLEMFENCWNKMPENMKELKVFILEPFNVEEENFDAAMLAALNEFKITGKINEFLKLGFFKELFGKVNYKK